MIWITSDEPYGLYVWRFFFTLEKDSPATSVVTENAATLLCCEAPEMFSKITKRHLISHQHGGEKIMNQLTFLAKLFL